MATIAKATHSPKAHNYTIVSISCDYACTVALTQYTQLQAFEWYTEGGGKHWGTITELIPKLSDFGITALWIPRKSEIPIIT